MVNLTSRQGLQDSVKEMEDAGQRVLVQKGLVDTESESIDWGDFRWLNCIRVERH